MQKTKKPTIWRYLIWGLVIGFAASLLVVKVFGTEYAPITKTALFQKLFGAPFSYDTIDILGGEYTWIYYEYAADFLRFLIVGIFMGLAVGISNYSIKRTIFSIIGGVLTGLLCTYYIYLNPRVGMHFFPQGYVLLFWYALSIIMFVEIFNRNGHDVLLHIMRAIIASIIVSPAAFVLGALSEIYTFGLSWQCARQVDYPLILFWPIALSLFNVAININMWWPIETINGHNK